MKLRILLKTYYIDFTINIFLLVLFKHMQKDTFLTSGRCGWHLTRKGEAQDWVAAQKSLSYLDMHTNNWPY